MRPSRLIALGKIGEVEQHPAKEHHHQRVQVGKEGGQPLQPGDEELLQRQEHKVVQPPQDEVPPGAMPHAG